MKISFQYFKRIFCILFIIFISALNCQSTTSYLKDRGNDAADILAASVDASGGISIGVGPISTGVYVGTNFAGFRNGIIATGKNYSDTGFALILGFDCVGDNLKLALRNKNTCNNKKNAFPLHTFGRFRIRAGILIGLSFEVNILEFLDFFVGIFGIDILGDDLNIYLDSFESDANKKLLLQSK